MKRPAALLVALLLAACAHQSAITTVRAGTNSYDLAYLAIGCWFGPVWGDALGEPIEQREANAAQRCVQTVQQVWPRDPKGNLERLRALEPTAISQLLSRVDAQAQGVLDDHERRDLVNLLGDVAGAQRDNMWARRATDRIRLDESKQKPHDRISDDERAALDPLLKVASLTALYTLNAGRYTADARALAVLSAMDRLNISRGLPRHVEVYADEPVFSLLFGLLPAAVDPDPAQETAPHVWVEYLAKAAANAGHPVPSDAIRTADRDLLGWAGMLDGVADRLREGGAQLTDRLQPVVSGTIRRLQAQAIGDRNRFADQKSRGASNL